MNKRWSDFVPADWSVAKTVGVATVAYTGYTYIVGIYERFTFGGFGSDHEDRIELIAAGATRGAEQLGVPLKECRVVVIGDTPKDVTAAKGAGGVCLGVGTGNFKVEELLASGAARAVDDLSVPGAVEFLLEG